MIALLVTVLIGLLGTVAIMLVGIYAIYSAGRYLREDDYNEQKKTDSSDLRSRSLFYPEAQRAQDKKASFRAL